MAENDDPPTPTPDKKTRKSIGELIATEFLGMDSYEEYRKSANLYGRNEFNIALNNILALIDSPDDIWNMFNVDNPKISADLENTLEKLSQFEQDQWIQLYQASFPLYTDKDLSEQEINRRAALIQSIMTKYKEYAVNKLQAAIANVEPFDDIAALMNQSLDLSGGSWQAYLNHLDDKKDFSIYLRQHGKWRVDNPPKKIMPWQCRIGGATFYVPPVNINVSQAFRAGSISGAVLRQPNSPKFNTGHSETIITMTIYFPNHETIWGFTGDQKKFNWDPMPVNEYGASDPSVTDYKMTPDAEVDYFLSSLRGLVTQFKYAPFLPIKNQYVNQTYGIDAVTLMNMTVSTMPEFPFCLVATVEMAKFNHAAYLPMIDDFDQAVHWGKYRQYMGRAAARLDATVNQGFLVKKRVEEGPVIGTPDTTEQWLEVEYEALPEGDMIPLFDKVKDITDGRYFDLYYPTNTPNRIFSPDTNDFRQPGEDLVVTTDSWNGALSFLGFDTNDKFNYNFFEFDSVVRNRTSSNERMLLHAWLKDMNIARDDLNKGSMEEFVAAKRQEALDNGIFTEENVKFFEDDLKFAWLTEIYVQILNSPLFKDKILRDQQERGVKTLNEWKIPMSKLFIDWDRVSVQGINVSLSNRIVSHQIQMQDEPVHQHIGGGDSRIDVSMIVFGEDNLIRFRRVFDHIGSLARLEHGAGVLGFLGIKNVVTALCGIKYVVPLTFEVDTIPNYPRAYNVRLSFIDFDIMQQARESLSSSQQSDLITAFGKRNPFLRLKQKWGVFNSYPDLPLEVRNTDNDVIGHLDPDWYFRSFRTDDDDLINWQTDEVNLVSMLGIVQTIENIRNQGTSARGPNVNLNLTKYHQLVSEYISNQVNNNGIALPDGVIIDDQGFVHTNGASLALPSDGSELYCYIGTLSEDQSKLYYIKTPRAGEISLGYVDKDSGKHVDDVQFPSATYAEDVATKNVQPISMIEGSVPLPLYQNEYMDKTDSPAKQFELMMKDWRYRYGDSRMLYAFPTYMLWLIDEGGQFAGYDLFDNFYGLNSVIDFSTVQSEDCIEDTLILRVSNLYQKLSTPLKDSIISDEDPMAESGVGRIISSFEKFQRNLVSGLTNTLVEINNVRLKPGVRIHLRAGYGSNPNSLQTVFNGVITNVEYGDIMTITAQSDAVELTALVNSTDIKGHSGKIDGGINCFTKTTPLNVWGGGTVTIGDIVDKGITPTLIGMDDQGNIVPTKVIDRFNFGPIDQWMEIGLSNRIDKTIRATHNQMIVTPGHHLFINGEYSQAGNAQVGDQVTSFSIAPSEHVMHVIKSALLGDGCIKKNGNGAYFSECHSDKQFEYLIHIKNLLGESSGSIRRHTTGYGSEAHTLTSKTYECLGDIRDQWYVGSKKVIPEDLSWIDDFSVAKWFMDDGSKGQENLDGNASACFATNGFTEDEVNRLAAVLMERYGVDTRVSYSKGWYLRVNIGSDSSISKMWESIAPFIPESMRYKLPSKYHCIDFVSDDFDKSEALSKSVSYIKSVKWLDNSSRPQGGGSRRKAYDIHTETGNYFCRGILVHNTGFWLSEPRDLMVRLLSMGSSAFKEYLSRRTAGAIFSENRFGIRHFGGIYYEEVTSQEKQANLNKYMAISREVSDKGQDGGTRADVTEALGDYASNMSTGSFGNFYGIINGSMVSVMEAMWLNGFRKRDYEIFKRNIYPGNGLGIAQFMAGDMIDAGLTLASVQQQLVSIDGGINGKDQDTSAEDDLILANKAIITEIQQSVGLDKDSLTPYLEQITTSDFDETTGEFFAAAKAKSIFSGNNWAQSLLGWVGNGFSWAFNSIANVSGWQLAISWAVNPGLVLSTKALRVGYRMMNGPLMQSFGVTSAMPDDDLQGYDEVSFRAQTYMKTVWDLFNMCAALLPNYIVAVRPFDNRSTIFYGKPHWLYTSGVIPITLGRDKAADDRPRLELPDAEMDKLTQIAKQNASSFEILQRQLADMRGLNNVDVIDNQYSSNPGTPGTVTPEVVNELPDTWPGEKAFIWKTEGWASQEMHIPADGEDVVKKTGHLQLDGLEERHKWPYNMDRNAGDGYGQNPPSWDDNGYAINWGGGETIIGPVVDKYYGTKFGIGPDGSIGNENPSAPGNGGALWGTKMPPDQEQWYISMPWPINSLIDKWSDFPEVTAKLTEAGDLTYENYRNKRVLVYSPDTQRAVICAPGDYGPSPTQDSTGTGHICGLSPDVHLALGTDHGAKVIVKAWPGDDTPFGPYTEGSSASTSSYAADAEQKKKKKEEKEKAENIAKKKGKGDNADENEPGDTVEVDIEGVKVTINIHKVDTTQIKWINKALKNLIAKMIEWTRGTRLTEEELFNMDMLTAYATIVAAGKEDVFKNAAKLAYSDPIIFAYQFGWALPQVPMYISVSTGVGVDLIGMRAKNVWDKWYNPSIEYDTAGRDGGEAKDLWEEFRISYPYAKQPREIYDTVFPMQSMNLPDLPNTNPQENYEEVMDMFMRFLWQIPFARGWVVIVANKKAHTVPSDVDNYSFDAVDEAWKRFLTSNDVVLNEAGTPYSAATVMYMQQNMKPGKDSTNPISAAAEAVTDWWDANVGSVIGMIGDTISGVLSAIRMSLMQTGIGLSQASNMQRQANIFNASLYDTIYYQAGSVDKFGNPDLMRLADNPFTREYGEPVIEIREPFQRVHYLSSFQHIINNGIAENINNVSTVVTAVSDGKYPVTVHFDKSISPEKQTETVIETGLFWDNALGSGLTGMFQPLIHPLEALRSVAKTSMGSSDLLSSRRVALSYLKENLKDIYTGELVVLGNADIRPHDLVYLADVYERMYGMFEVEKVIHHFTPELGFITSIVPNAIVSVNDPGRWSMLSWMWKKYSDYTFRNDARAMLNAKADRAVAAAGKVIKSEDLADMFSTQITGALQWTHGNTALIKDLSAMYGTGGMRSLSSADELANQLDKVNTALLVGMAGLRTATTISGIALAIGGSPVIGATVAAGGYVIGDLLWDAWKWVRDNLLDQHGCYIQYMTKDGQPMDAGLSYAQGVAVGQAHSIDAFPTILGLNNQITYSENGHYRITTNDILKAMGWSEVETAFIQRQTSWFVNNINKDILKLAGRDDMPASLDGNYAVLFAKVLEPVSDTEGQPPGVEDGDTLNVYVEAVYYNHGIPNTTLTGNQRIRLAYVNTAELLIHDQYIDSTVDEVAYNAPNDLSRLAAEYMRDKFSIESNRYIAIRVSPQADGTITDKYGRLIGVIFHQLPQNLYSSPDVARKKEILCGYAAKYPFIPWDAYMEDGRPYTINWELVMTGYGNVDVRDSIYDSPWREGALGYVPNTS